MQTLRLVTQPGTRLKSWQVQILQAEIESFSGRLFGYSMDLPVRERAVSASRTYRAALSADATPCASRSYSNLFLCTREAYGLAGSIGATRASGDSGSDGIVPRVAARKCRQCHAGTLAARLHSAITSGWNALTTAIPLQRRFGIVAA